MKEEAFDVVDENDEVVGQASRKECHEKGVIHRSVMFFVFDEEGRVLVTKRTGSKDFFPGYWSIVLGGHVNSGEIYEDAVLREVKEELGIEAKPIFLKSFKKRIPEEKENVKVYSFVARGPIKLSMEELERGEFLQMDELEERLKCERFLPETEVLLDILKGFKSASRDIKALR